MCQKSINNQIENFPFKKKKNHNCFAHTIKYHEKLAGFEKESQSNTNNCTRAFVFLSQSNGIKCYAQMIIFEVSLFVKHSQKLRVKMSQQ